MRLCPPWRSPPAPGDTECTGLRPADDSGKTGSLSAAAHSALLVVQRLDVCTCVDLHLHQSARLSICLSVCLRVSECARVRVCVCTCACIYLVEIDGGERETHTHTHTHTHTPTHTHTHTALSYSQ